MTDHDSIAGWFERCRAGDSSATAELFRRYSQRLCALAERQIGTRLQARVDGEDIVQSAFRTFFRRTTAGEFVIEHSSSLWQLLVTITIHNVQKQAEHHLAGKRDPNREVTGEEFLLQNIQQEPTSDQAVALVDELESLLCSLDPDEAATVRLALEGFSSVEIAEQLGVSRWTIRSRLNRVGHLLEERLRS
jgi:RNA polymerase sigma-70 factor (ECF subfamily)